MTALERLRAARDLLSNPKAWAQREAAVDDGGARVWPNSPKAVAWCATGALDKVGGEAPAIPFLYAAIPVACREDCVENCECHITGYNDSLEMDHKKLLKWFDKAIKLAEKVHQ